MDQALNSQKTPHTSPLRASYGMSFVSILMKNDRVIKGFYIAIKGAFCRTTTDHHHKAQYDCPCARSVILKDMGETDRFHKT